MANYSRFGYKTLEPGDVDPAWEQCISNYFTKSGITASQMEKDACPTFMAQRCAVKWDDACSVYLTDSDIDSGGFKHMNLTWLNEVAKKKYCRPYTDAPR